MAYVRPILVLAAVIVRSPDSCEASNMAAVSARPSRVVSLFGRISF